MITDIYAERTAEYIKTVRGLIADSGKLAYVFSFGCQQNEADGEKMLGMAREMGYGIASSPDQADLILINTCAIREHAELKALSLLGRFKALKKKKPSLIIGVMGCMSAEPHRAELIKKDFHYITFTLEPNMLHRMPELVARYMLDGRRSFILGEDKGDIVEGMPASRRSSHRAWVSVMYGCNNFCSYCIVPYVRGRERSRDSASVIEECKSLVADGVKEITLLGQNVNSYRSDMSFAELISAIAEIEGDFIIRFMTSHPKDTSDELISAMKKYRGKIAPYFHLPLQAGSNRILKAMNRTYTAESYLEIVDKLRGAVPDIALSTDVIIGFPGEEDEDFERTYEILSKVRFDSVYSFLYSPREGTLAAKMDNPVPREIMDKRMARLLSLQDEISLEKNLPLVGRRFKVLCDSVELREGREIYTGRTPHNKLVHFTADTARVGEFTEVEIQKVGAFDLFGAAIKEK